MLSDVTNFSAVNTRVFTGVYILLTGRSAMNGAEGQGIESTNNQRKRKENTNYGKVQIQVNGVQQWHVNTAGQKVVNAEEYNANRSMEVLQQPESIAT